MVRLTAQLLRREFKYWKRYMWREMYRHTPRRIMFLPLVGWKEDIKRGWNVDENQPWSQEFHEKNKPWSPVKKTYVEPLKDWPYIKGDRGCLSTLTRQAHTPSVNQRRYYTPMANVPEGVLLGLGNPLLDVSVVTDESFLKKYDLEANNAILAEDKHNEMFVEMMAGHMNPEYIAGGATQNTIRVAQWILQKTNATTFFGCVGNDQIAKIIEQKAREVGVNVHYQVKPEYRTGLCAAVITGRAHENRSLVTRLGAARKFTSQFLENAEHWALVEKAQFIYIGGFVFTVSPSAIRMLAEHASQNNKPLMMNLSAPFLCSYFADPEINIMQHIDILVGNETEAATYCKLQGIEGANLKELASKVSLLPKADPSRGRTVIFTHGREPTVIAESGKVTEYAVPRVPKELIHDTTGCGDAFVGGFLSQLVQGKPIAECVRYAKMAAIVIIQHDGCTFPPKPDFTEVEKLF